MEPDTGQWQNPCLVGDKLGLLQITDSGTGRVLYVDGSFGVSVELRMADHHRALS